MIRLSGAVLACLLSMGMVLTACSSRTDTIDVLTKAGYTSIEPGGYAWFACAEDDFYHTKFTAINPIGKKVSGVVCSGILFKNATIRF